MSKCPKCGAEIEAGVKFCLECGERIPQTKECPQCHTQLPLAAKFCGECGHSFIAQQATTASGAFMGDKNVISGDIHNTVSNDNSVTNNTSTVNNSSTVINNMGTDPSREVVTCCVCGKQHLVTDMSLCEDCHQHVCAEHYDANTRTCNNCKKKRELQARKYRVEIKSALIKVSRMEFYDLDDIKESGREEFARANATSDNQESYVSIKKPKLEQSLLSITDEATGDIVFETELNCNNELSRIAYENDGDVFRDRPTMAEQTLECSPLIYAIEGSACLYVGEFFSVGKLDMSKFRTTYRECTIGSDTDDYFNVIWRMEYDGTNIEFNSEIKGEAHRASIVMDDEGEIRMFDVWATEPQECDLMLLSDEDAEEDFDDEDETPPPVDALGQNGDKPKDEPAAEPKEPPKPTRYKISIKGALMCTGQAIFKSQEDFDDCNREKYREVSSFRERDVSCKFDHVDLVVTNEDSGKESEATDVHEKHIDDGELFTSSLKRNEVALCVSEIGTCERVSYVDLTEPFDFGKMSIIYRWSPVPDDDGSKCRVIWSVEYDGKRLPRELNETGECCERHSYLITKDGSSEIDIWSDPVRPHEFKISIASTYVKMGCEGFASKDALMSCDRTVRRDPGELKEYDAGLLVDRAELTVTDEHDGKKVFEETLDSTNDDSQIKYQSDNNVDFCHEHIDFSNGGVGLFVRTDSAQKQKFTFDLLGEFDPAKLNIEYRSFRSPTGWYGVIRSVSYDGETLKSKLTGRDDVTNKESWGEDGTDFFDFNVWATVTKIKIRVEYKTSCRLGCFRYATRESMLTACEKELVLDADNSVGFAELAGAAIAVTKTNGTEIYSSNVEQGASSRRVVSLKNVGSPEGLDIVRGRGECLLFVRESMANSEQLVWTLKRSIVGQFDPAKLSFDYYSVDTYGGGQIRLLKSVTYDGKTTNLNKSANWEVSSVKRDMWTVGDDGYFPLRRMLSDKIYAIKEIVRLHNAGAVFLSGSNKFDKKFTGFGTQSRISLKSAPSKDDVFALIDLTLWGSCSNGIAFAKNGIWCVMDKREESFFLDWDDFASDGLVTMPDRYCVSLTKDNKRIINRAYMNGETVEVCELFEKLLAVAEFSDGRNSEDVSAMVANAESLRNLLVKFKNAHKCKRVFISGDEYFELKCQSFMKSALARWGSGEVADPLTLTDDVVWKKGDSPRSVTIEMSDVIAIFDNTGVGFFDNIKTSKCDFGTAITTKGFITLNYQPEGLPDTSGFVSWETFLVGNQSSEADGFVSGVCLFSNSDDKTEYPRGRGKYFFFGQSKLEETDIFDVLDQLRKVVQK